MTDAKMRKAVIKTLEKANKPMTPVEIADKIGITKDFWVLEAILNQLTLIGAIRVEYNPFGKRLFFVENYLS